MTRETIAVTGATGFLGSHVLEALLQSNQYDVVIVKRSSSSLEKIVHLPPTYQVFDLDKAPLAELFRHRRVAAIVHTAVNYGRGGIPSHEVLQANLLFPIELIEEAIRHGTALFVNADSYFNKASKQYSSLHNYALSKKFLTSWLRFYSAKIKIVNVVLEHVYGPRDSTAKFITGMIRQIAVDQVQQVLLTPGHQKRDFIHVSDVANALVQIVGIGLSESFRFREYNVGTGRSIPVRDAVETIKRLSGSNTELLFGALPYREDEIMNSVADLTELSNYGWTAKHDFESGVRDVLNHHARHV